jgi:hypothetical protein
LQPVFRFSSGSRFFYGPNVRACQKFPNDPKRNPEKRPVFAPASTEHMHRDTFPYDRSGPARTARNFFRAKFFELKVEKRKKSWRESWKSQNFSGRNFKNKKSFGKIQKILKKNLTAGRLLQ